MDKIQENAKKAFDEIKRKNLDARILCNNPYLKELHELDSDIPEKGMFESGYTILSFKEGMYMRPLFCPAMQDTFAFFWHYEGEKYPLIDDEYEEAHSPAHIFEGLRELFEKLQKKRPNAATVIVQSIDDIRAE